MAAIIPLGHLHFEFLHECGQRKQSLADAFGDVVKAANITDGAELRDLRKELFRGELIVENFESVETGSVREFGDFCFVVSNFEKEMEVIAHEAPGQGTKSTESKALLHNGNKSLLFSKV